MMTLNAEKRDMNVKAKKLRREGYVPGSLCGRDLEESVPLKISEFEAERFMRKNMKGSRTVLQIGEQKYNAIVKDVDYNPLMKRIMFIDFQMLVAGEKISTTAQVVLLHEELAKGSVDEEISEIHYKADPADIVEKVYIDFEKLGDQKCVKVKDIKELMNDKIELITSADATIVDITEGSQYEEETEDAEGEAEAVAAS